MARAWRVEGGGARGDVAWWLGPRKDRLGLHATPSVDDPSFDSQAARFRDVARRAIDACIERSSKP